MSKTEQITNHLLQARSLTDDRGIWEILSVLIRLVGETERINAIVQARESELQRRFALEETGLPAVPIHALGLPTRMFNALWNNGYRTVGSLILEEDDVLSSLRNFGPKSLGEVRARVAAFRIEHGGQPDPAIQR